MARISNSEVYLFNFILNNWNLIKAEFPVWTSDEERSIPGNVVRVNNQLRAEQWIWALLVNHIDIGARSGAWNSWYEWILWMNFDHFANVADAFAVDGNAEKMHWSVLSLNV